MRSSAVGHRSAVTIAPPGRPDARVRPMDVQAYYDRHTTTFLTLGHGRRTGAIHRAVWAPGITTREQAMRFVDDAVARRVADLVRSTAPVRVVDLGCGVGSSLVYLAARLPIVGTGITLSPVQSALARRRIEDAGLAARVRCLVGDFCDLPDETGSADLAYAVEAFVHATDAAAFFSQCAALLPSGGTLVICDDTVADIAVWDDPRAAARLARFREGWRAHSLLDLPDIRRLAAEAGFGEPEVEDLTPYLELQRPRDVALAAVEGLLARLPGGMTRFGHLVGGSALRACLVRGWIRYRLLTFRRH